MNKVVVSISASLLLASLAVVGVHAEPHITAKTPEQAVKYYYDAEKTGNIDLMKSLAQDEGFVDEEAQTESYLENYQHNPLIDYTIVSQEKIDDSHVNFMVERTYQSDSLPALPVTAFMENGSWKVLIQPIEINMIEGSPDYGKVSIRKSKQKKSGLKQAGIISPEVDVVYWNFSDLQKNTSILGSNYFGQFRTDGQFTINGWQQSSAGVASVNYAVVSVVGGTTKVHASQGVGNNYPKSGTWFNYYLTGVPKVDGTPYRMQFTNSHIYNVSAGGNGYE